MSVVFATSFTDGASHPVDKIEGMSGHFVRRFGAPLAWIVAAVSFAFLSLGLAIAPHVEREGVLFGGTNTVVTAISFLAFSVIGAIIITRQGNHPVGWLFCISGVAWSFLSLSEAYVRYTRIFELGRLPAEDVIVWASSWQEFVGIVATPVLVFLVFPTGRLVSPRWRYAVGWSLAAAIIGILGSALAPGPFEDYESVSNPFGVGGTAGRIFTIMKDMGWPLLIPAVIASAVSLLVRFRRSRGEQRLQIQWLLLAAVSLAVYLLFFAVSAALGNDELAENLLGLALATIPVAAAVAILKYRLYDIDVVVNRTLVYGSLTVTLAAAYALFVILLQSILAPFVRGSQLAVAASTLAVAALFRPARVRTQQAIDRRFYRAKYDAAEALARFTTRLRDEIELDTLEADVLAVVDDTVKPQHASLWLRPPEAAADDRR